MKTERQEAPRLTPVEEAVLVGLRDARGRELYGLELLRTSGGALTRGSLYTTLDRMEAKGYLVSRRETTPQSEHVPIELRLPRRLFKITGLGLAALCANEAARTAFRQALAGISL